jgi:DNA-binding response OmpR family regulator
LPPPLSGRSRRRRAYAAANLLLPPGRLTPDGFPNNAAPTRRALVVEDEHPIRQLLRVHLEKAGFEVHECIDGASALERCRQERFELIVLDVLLPGRDGLSVCRSIRAEGPNTRTAILIVTALDAESDKVAGLESGADDYLTKPFGVRELLARVTALTRRDAAPEHSSPTGAHVIPAGELLIEVERRVVTVRDNRVQLNEQEFRLLRQLVAHRGMVCSRSALLRAALNGGGAHVAERTVDVTISRLRRKLERDPRRPQLILTAWGAGYKLAD